MKAVSSLVRTQTVVGDVLCRHVADLNEPAPTSSLAVPAGTAQLQQQPVNPAAQMEEEEEGYEAAGYQLAPGDQLRPFQTGCMFQVRPEPQRQPMAQPTMQHALAAARRNIGNADWAAMDQRAQQSGVEMREVLVRLSRFQTPEGQLHCDQQQFNGMVQQILLPGWRPGNTYHHAPGWQTALQSRRGVGDAAEALRIVSEGVRLSFTTNPYSPAQQQRPQFRKKEAALLGMLGGSEEARQLLKATQPPRVWLGNLQSVSDHEEFVEEKVAEALQAGTLVPWESDWGEPHSVSPLGVAVHPTSGKQRLTVAPLLLNWWEPYHSFKQDRLQVRALQAWPVCQVA